MRRYYSRKVIDVLIKVTRNSLEIIRKKFLPPESLSDGGGGIGGNTDGNTETSSESSNVVGDTSDSKENSEYNEPLFIVHAILNIPNICLKPKLDEVQEALVIASKHITGVSRGVGQWTGAKTKQVCLSMIFLFFYTIRTYRICLNKRRDDVLSILI